MNRNWQNLVNTYKNTPSDGDTYTQKALMDAQTMLNNVGGTDRRKVIFLLTDGAPNMSAVPIALKNDTNIYYDGVRITQNDGNSIAGGKLLASGSNWRKILYCKNSRRILYSSAKSLYL